MWTRPGWGASERHISAFASLVLGFVLTGNVEEPFYKPRILSCGKLNMYKSAKGEIQTRQGGFLAYEVSGKTPTVIHGGGGGGGEGASASVGGDPGASTLSSVEASNNPSGFSASFCSSGDQTLTFLPKAEADFQNSHIWISP